MNSENQNQIGAVRRSAFNRIEKMHPVKMLLSLCLLGIGILFLVLLIGFVRTEAWELKLHRFSFPRFFSISTLLLVFSSYTFSKVPGFYRKDNLRKMALYLAYSVLLGFGFIMAQVAGWYELASQGVFLQGRPLGSYLYLLSALHILHLAGGLLFLMFLYFKSKLASSDAVRTLVYIRDPYRKLQINLVGSYWHFMGGLWLIMFVTFLFGF